jgi:hypothetical protein
MADRILLESGSPDGLLLEDSSGVLILENTVYWTPADYTTAVWLDANDSGTITIATGVSQWDDKSGNANHVTQGTGSNQPTYSATGWDGSSLPSIAFSTSFEQLVSSGAVLGAATAAEAFYVFRTLEDPPASTDNSRAPIDCGSDGAADNSHEPYTDGSVYSRLLTNTRKTVGNPASSFTTGRIIRVRSAASDWQYWIDGTSFFTTATNTVDLNETLIVGPGAAAERFVGHIAEIIFVGSTVTDADADLFEGYLAHKWGLADNLAAGHPYKAAPPATPTLWTPDRLTTPPRLWADSRAAVWSGSNLSSIANLGSDGGSGTITSVTLGAGLDAFNALSFNTDSTSKIDFTLGAWSSGEVAHFVVAYSDNNSEISGVIVGPGAWAASGRYGAYLQASVTAGDAGAGNLGAYASADGFNTCGSSGAPGPAIYGRASLAVTTWHLASAEFSTAGVVSGRENGLDVSYVREKTGTVPNYGGGTWSVGRVDAGETIIGDIAVLMVFDQLPTADEWERLEGWAAHRFGLTARLDAGHPYKTDPPLVDSGIEDLVVGSAAYAYTATAASIEYGREIVPEAASYTYTATAASIERGFEVVPESAAYLYTPTDATFDRTYIVAVAGATYTYSATDASIEFGREIVPESAAYTYTAQSVSIERGYEIAADSASYLYGVGAELTFDRTYIVAVGSATYTYTATDASIEFGREIAPEASSFTYTATDASIEYGRELAVEAASYLYTPTDASIEYGREIVPEAAPYLYTATAATITYSVGAVGFTGPFPFPRGGVPGDTAYTLAVDSASYAYTATAASIEYGREIVPESASFAYSATDASIEYGRELAVGSASFLYSATDASIEYGRELAVGSASYLYTPTDASLEYGREVVADAASYLYTPSDVTITWSGEDAPVGGNDNAPYFLASCGRLMR